MASALATCLLLLVSIYQNFLGSNVDRTVANAYIIRKELSNLRHAAFECKITNFISISPSETEKSSKNTFRDELNKENPSFASLVIRFCLLWRDQNRNFAAL